MHADVKLADAKGTAARAFVRSLNILLKFARLYGFNHARTATQFGTTWNELRAAVSSDGAGLLLGAAGTQLLIDGVPVGASATERSFCQLLSAAGLASIFFSTKVTREEVARFAQAFPSGNAQPTALAQQLKVALAGTPGIRINEIRFVAEDSSLTEAKLAGQLTARTLGVDGERFSKEWLNDPQKLLQLIAAAEGSRGHGAATGPQGGSPSEEDELQGVMRLFTRLGQLGGQPGETNLPSESQQQIPQLHERTQLTLRQALATLATHAPNRPNEPMLVKLAEHMAIRFALDQFERGEVRVNAVRQMLDRMSQEIVSLRK
ncbi:MAG TPA: hypothetical protein VHM88_12045, partial [Candidatus Acidoferrales bacterium]|nr:hypothetical protein [Candidatus Acidoferrales bacterium]